jgi:signal transduction histidine kinase
MGLTLLFSGVMFLQTLLTLLAVGVIVFIAVKLGLFVKWQKEQNLFAFFILIAVFSLVGGTIMTVLVGKIPLKPINKIINAMKRLASGDFRTRLHFGNLLSKHPTIRELTESFNTMASELENTELLRSDFVNNFSHEFKTPIVSIAGFTNLLRQGTLSEKEQKEYLDIIAEESMRLSDMATNVMNLTKVENQTILTDVKSFNLSEQLRSSILLLEDKWEKKNLEIDIDFDEHMISANEELLKQVWLNLLDNAIKFSLDNGTIGVSIIEDSSNIAVSVSNAGNKIPEHQLDRIFRKFYQADESHAVDGNGIGLAIVKRIAELHGGTVSVDSTDDITVFTVKLPQNNLTAELGQ